MSKIVKIKQIGSPIRRQDYQEQCLKALGLGKMYRERTVEDTPAIRGLLRKVHHLVKIL